MIKLDTRNKRRRFSCGFTRNDHIALAVYTLSTLNVSALAPYEPFRRGVQHNEYMSAVEEQFRPGKPFKLTPVD